MDGRHIFSRVSFSSAFEVWYRSQTTDFALIRFLREGQGDAGGPTDTPQVRQGEARVIPGGIPVPSLRTELCL